MKYTFLYRSVIVVALVGVAANAQEKSGSSSQPMRRVYFHEGRSLIATLQAGAGDLEVLSGSAPPFAGIPPAGMSRVEWITRLADWAALVRVTGRRGALTPSGDWIRADVTATVVEVLKNTPSNRLQAGATVSFFEEGGEISVGARTIRGVVGWSRPLRSATTYLLFGGVSESSELLVAATDTYELTGNTFTGVTNDGRNALAAASSNAVLEEIKSKPALPLPWHASPPPRRVYYQGKPILSHLNPTDTIVEVVDGGSPALEIADLQGRLLEPLATGSDLVAIVRVTGIDSRLSPDGTWIVSTITSDIVDLLKPAPDAKPSWLPDGPLVFAANARSLTIGQQIIVAASAWAKPLQKNGEYLVFGWRPDGELRIAPESIYEISGPRLNRHALNEPGQNDIERDSLANVKARVRAVR